MKLKLTLSILLLSIGSALMGQNISYEQKEVFDDIAYSISSTNNKNVIVKWQMPIRYQILGELPEYRLNEIDNTFAQLKVLTGLEIKKTSVNEEANVIIKFEGYKTSNTINMKSGMDLKYIGGVSHRTNENSEITNATMIVVPSSFPTKSEARYHLVRDMLKIMGFIRTSTKAGSSVFYSYENSTIKIGKFDSGIISLLYSPIIKPGMNKQQVDKLLN